MARKTLLACLVSGLFLVACGGDDGGGGVMIPDASNQPRPDAPFIQENCDLVMQNDCILADHKCTLVDSGDGMTLKSQCVPITGMAGDGEDCMRTSDTSGGWGRDTCGPGLWCSGVGVKPPSAGGSRICRKYCRNITDCGANEFCLALYDEGDVTNPPTGFCLPRCTLFDHGTCTPELSCDTWFPDIDGTTNFATCRYPGSVMKGGNCNPPAVDCAQELICVTNNQTMESTCTEVCDATHMCPTMGDQCQVAAANLNDAGFCVTP